MKVKKINLFVFITLIAMVFVININDVMAATNNDLMTSLNGSYSFKTTNYNSGAFRVGVKGWSSATPYKGINSADNLNAYCVSMNHKIGFENGESYTSKCVNAYVKNFTLGRSIIAGYIVEVINDDDSIKASDATMKFGNGSSTRDITTESACKDTKGCKWDNRREYAYFVYKVLTLNSYFSSFDVAGSVNFRKVNKSNPKYGREDNADGEKLADKIQNYIDQAIEKYQKEYSSSTSINITYNRPSSLTMIKRGNFYITSSPFRNTTSTKLANGTTVSNTVTASGPSGSSVSFCTDSAGNSCSSTANVGTDYYIKVVPGSSSIEGGSVNISISANANFSYPRLLMYCRTRNTNNQAIGVHGRYVRNISDSDGFNLSTPKDNSKSIVVSKVDSTGKSLAGSKFELTDNNGKKYDLVQSSDGKSFSYSSSDSSLDFSNLKFTLKEVTVPEGYVIHADISNISIGSNSIKYYQTSGDSSNDKEITEKMFNSQYICKVITTTDGSSVTEYKPLVDDACDSYVPPVTETPSDSENNDPVSTDSTSSTSGTSGSSTTDDTEEEPSVTVTSEKVCVYHNTSSGSGNYESLDSSVCENKDSYYKIESNGNHVFIEIPNLLNNVKISKVDVVDKEEVPGAELKICTSSDYQKDGNDCTAAKTVNDVEMSWTSNMTNREFSGLKKGDYYIIETVPPLGYKLATTVTPFSIDENGVVKTGDTVVEDNTIVIDNSLNEVTISKTDIATSNELPGAVLSICEAFDKSSNVIENGSSTTGDGTTVATTSDSTTDYFSTNHDDYMLVTDEIGDCVPVTLQDGSGPATWISTDEPHKIQGLPSGVYYLVETTAPNGYATAESILFRMNDNGNLTDIEGNILEDNKIVMMDKPIGDVKTGRFAIVVAIFVGVGAIGLGTYYYSKVNGGLAFAGNVISGKIRKRRIHK